MTTTQSSVVYNDPLATIFHGDCRDVLKNEIERESVSCVITSPPYNAGKEYEDHDDAMPMDAYWDLISEVADLTHDVCRPGAFACWNIPMWSGNREQRTYMPDLFRFHVGMHGWEFVGEIIWAKGSSVESANVAGATWGNYPTTPAIRNASEPILVFRKRGGSPRPIDDVTWEEWVKYTIGLWAIPGERNQTDHPAKFPAELVTRLIKLYSAKGETVLDPFSGSGTTCAVAKSMGRQSIGIDISERYCHLAADRLRQGWFNL